MLQIRHTLFMGSAGYDTIEGLEDETGEEVGSYSESSSGSSSRENAPGLTILIKLLRMLVSLRCKMSPQSLKITIG